MERFNSALNEVLQQSKYDVLTGRIPDFNKVVADTIVSILKAILRRLNLPAMADYNTNVIINIFLIIAVIVIIIIAFLIYMHFSRRHRRTYAMDDIFSVLEDRDVTYSELISQADAFYRNGNLREAVRYRFISVLFVLNKNNLIYLHKSKTNRQLKNELKNSAPRLLPAFDSVIGTFNLTWFGFKLPDADKYADFSNEAVYIAEEAEKHENTA